MRENNGRFEIFNFELTKQEFDTLDEHISLEKALENMFENDNISRNPSTAYLNQRLNEVFNKGNELKQLVKKLNHKNLPYIYTEINVEGA